MSTKRLFQSKMYIDGSCYSTLTDLSHDSLVNCDMIRYAKCASATVYGCRDSDYLVMNLPGQIGNNSYLCSQFVLVD